MKNEAQKDTYDAWIERMASGREGKPLTAGEVVSPGNPTAYSSIEFIRLSRLHYTGEVGKRGNEYIFHFFPKSPFDSSGLFEEIMGDIFLEVFKNPQQIEAAWSSELNSWAVKVTGFVNTIWGDDQALSIFDKLDKALFESDRQ